MAVLTPPDVYRLAIQAGFSTQNYPGQNFSPADEIVAIAEAESHFDTTWRHSNPPSIATINGQQVTVPASTDRGILQINNVWNSGVAPFGPLVTDQQADDPAWSFGWAFKVSNGGDMNLLKAYWVTAAQGKEVQFRTPGGGLNITPTPTPSPTPTPAPTDVATALGQAIIDLAKALKDAGVL